MLIKDVNLRRFRLSDTFLSDFKDASPPWGPIGEFTFFKTYSRRVEDEDRKEQFWENLRRVIEGMMNTQKFHCYKHAIRWDGGRAQHLAQMAYELAWAFKWLPSGRGLWLMGTDFMYKHGSAGLNSCAFVTTAGIDAFPSQPFTWAMEALTLGVGVGFDVRGAGLLNIQKPSSCGSYTYTVPDSREGWVESVGHILNAYLSGDSLPTMDYSAIRPKGSKLKAFGGTASGPDPLRILHENLIELLSGMRGDLLGSETLVDIFTLISQCVVSGNVRRSAMIALGRSGDSAFLGLKANGGASKVNRWYANNSVIAKLGGDYGEIAALNTTNGEPGVLWLENVQKFGRMVDGPTWADRRVMGVNPCVPGDTLIMTDTGPRKIATLVSTPFTAVVDTKTHQCLTGAFYTGNKPVFEVRTQQGHTVRATADHKILVASRVTVKQRYEEWVKVLGLEAGDQIVLNNTRESEWCGQGTFSEGWVLGSLLGDGHLRVNDDRALLEFWGEHKQMLLDYALDHLRTLGGPEQYHKGRTGCEVTERDMCSVSSRQLLCLARDYGLRDDKSITNTSVFLTASSDFHRGFLRGLFDADGSPQGNHKKGISVRLSSVHTTYLRLAQQMLLNLGINSTLYTDRTHAGTKTLPNGKGGTASYPVKAGHELVISCDNLHVFNERVGFAEPSRQHTLTNLLASYRRKPNRERFVATVEDVVVVGVLPVYDATVEGVHRFGADGVIVHNCGEQALESMELCNLVETFPARHETTAEYKDTLTVAHLYGKTVTLLETHWPTTNLVMQRNRRMGISQSGIIQALQRHGHENMRQMCDEGYKHLRECDRELSDYLRIPESVKLTSVKPSGTVSLLPGASPGIHYPHSEYYIRRQRIANTSHLLAVAKAAGYHVEPCVGSEATTSVIEFPIHESDYSGRTKSEVSMWEQLCNAAMWQRYWADNQVSITVTFNKDEAEQIPRALTHFEDQLKCVSLLPLLDTGDGDQPYAQLPYEGISKEVYDQAVSRIKVIDYSRDMDEAAGEKYCDGESCSIDN